MVKTTLFWSSCDGKNLKKNVADVKEAKSFTKKENFSFFLANSKETFFGKKTLPNLATTLSSQDSLTCKSQGILSFKIVACMMW
jgi:hypothetical protein